LNEYLNDDELQEIIKYNREIVRSRNEPFGVDENKIKEIFHSVNLDYESQSYANKRERIIKKASVLIARITWEQPFDEGNRETALAIGITFMNRNGFDLLIENYKLEINELLNRIIYKFENDPSICLEVELFLDKNVVKL
jgi:prophage maintenance system killer protein